MIQLERLEYIGSKRSDSRDKDGLDREVVGVVSRSYEKEETVGPSEDAYKTLSRLHSKGGSSK